MKQAALTIVIVHWNSESSLRTLLTSLTSGEVDHPLSQTAQIVVVDNNSISKRKQPSWIRSFKTVEWVWNSLNQGYSFACNQGVLRARGRWIFFLNPDVLISWPSLEELISVAQTKSWSAASPASKSDDYIKPVPSFLSLCVEFSPLSRFVSLDAFKQKTLIGGMLLIKKSVLLELGGWDERFWLWFEDSDLTKRLIAHRKAYGFASITHSHIGGDSIAHLKAETQRDIFFLSMRVFAEKHFSKWQRVVLAILTRRFSIRHVLPPVNDGVCMVIPNMKKQLLDSVLRCIETSKNEQYCIVTSALNPRMVWKYRANYPFVRFIVLDQNTGFAETVNVGLRAAPYEWIGTANDDTVFETGWTQKALKSLTKARGDLTQVSGFNPVILSKDGSIESAGITIEMKGKAYPVTTKPKTSVASVKALNAAAVVYRNQALFKTGLFDAKFGSYLEDVDLSIRLRKQNWSQYVVSSVEVTHEGQQTSQNLGRYKRWLDFKNWWILTVKHWTLTNWSQHWPSILLERCKNLYGVLKT